MRMGLRHWSQQWIIGLTTWNRRVKKFSILAEERNRNQQNRLEAASPSRLENRFDCVTVLLKGCYEIKLAFFNNLLLLAQNTIRTYSFDLNLSLSLYENCFFSRNNCFFFSVSVHKIQNKQKGDDPVTFKKLLKNLNITPFFQLDWPNGPTSVSSLSWRDPYRGWWRSGPPTVKCPCPCCTWGRRPALVEEGRCPWASGLVRRLLDHFQLSVKS